MANPMADGCAESAASVLFNLPGYWVLEVTGDASDGQQRMVLIATTAVADACPSCGTLTSRVHQRTRQRLRDVGFDGPVGVVWSKKRWRCPEAECPRATFTEATEQVPPRARLTARLREAVVVAVGGEVRAVDRVAAQFAVSWPTVMRLLTAATAALERFSGPSHPRPGSEPS